MLALLIAVAGLSFAFNPLWQSQEKPPPPPAAEQKPSAQENTAQGAQKETDKETERFVPSQKTSADNSATFPVDI